jgi:hypothetical protein
VREFLSRRNSGWNACIRTTHDAASSLANPGSMIAVILDCVDESKRESKGERRPGRGVATTVVFITRSTLCISPLRYLLSPLYFGFAEMDLSRSRTNLQILVRLLSDGDHVSRRQSEPPV